MTMSSATRRALEVALGPGGTLSLAELAQILDQLTLSADGTTLVIAKLVAEPVLDNLVARAGGAQAGTAMTAAINRVVTVASAGDSVQLPASLPGQSIVVVNAGANSLNVFGQTGDAIDAGGANAASAIAAGKTATFFCTAAGRWHKQLSA